MPSVRQTVEGLSVRDVTPPDKRVFKNSGLLLYHSTPEMKEAVRRRSAPLSNCFANTICRHELEEITCISRFIFRHVCMRWPTHSLQRWRHNKSSIAATLNASDRQMDVFSFSFESCRSCSFIISMESCQGVKCCANSNYLTCKIELANKDDEDGAQQVECASDVKDEKTRGREERSFTVEKRH